MTHRCVFVTGATGYIGRALIPALLARGHSVKALTRKARAHNVPPGASIVEGNALESDSYSGTIAPARGC
jgi:uncharacterized protein YbjT (DUF2867 family)